MKTLGCLALIATLLALAGCDEAGENVVWSPDGRQAAVIGTKGLYLCDAGGKLSPLLVPRATHARWLPDGKRLVVARSMDFATWREVAPQLSDAERNYVVTTAKRLLDNWLAAAPEELEIALRPPGRLADRRITLDRHALNMYARDELAQAVEKKAPEQARQLWKDLENDRYELRIVQVYELADGGTVKAGPIVARLLAPLQDLRVSPAGTAVAVTCSGFGDEDPCDLYVAPLPGAGQAAGAGSSTEPRIVADRAGAYPDWTPDGTHLVYAHATLAGGLNDAVRLGSIRMLPVCEPDGSLLKEFHPDEPYARRNGEGKVELVEPPAEDLAGILYTPSTKVRCLRDRTVLFSGVRVTLPATGADMPTRGSLFAIHPDRRAIVQRIVPAQAEEKLADTVYHFEPSPDGTRVAVVGTGGQVTVLTLASGDVAEIAPKVGTARAPMVATWRTNDQLCYATGNKEGAEQRPAEVYLWSPDGATNPISGDWPNDVVQALQSSDKRPQVTTVPATEPGNVK